MPEMTKKCTIRTIVPSDNAEIARIIRAVLEEFGAARPGTVYTDPTTDDLYALFETPGSAYFIAELDGKMLGGCGVFPTKGLPDNYAELVKLYLLPEARGKGIGKMLMETCALSAKESGYTHLYLETMPELSIAVDLYERVGFRYLDAPCGVSGHHACNLWMLKEL